MAVRCLIKRKNKILLCYAKSDEFYFLPGGSVKFQEELHEAIYRELREEMGINKNDIKIKNLICLMEVMYDDLHCSDPIFEVEISSDINISSIENHIDFKWINIDDIAKIDIKPSILEGWLRGGCKENHIISNDLDEY